MHLNTFKVLPFALLIFLTCYTCQCRGMSITELKENNPNINLSSDFKSTVYEQAIAAVSEDPCVPNPCENGGSCIHNSDFSENFECECKEEYIGSKCEIDQCALLQCEDDQICVVRDGYVECKEVTENKDKCDEIVCQNDGTCRLSWGNATCECPDEYTGPNCETHKCEEILCENNGTCKINWNNVTCECPDEYTGPYCETHKCEDLCLNNGSCKVTDGIASCECSSEYTGSRCEMVYLCNSNCKETDGFCVIENYNQTGECRCPKGTRYKWESGCTSLKDICLSFCEEMGGVCTPGRFGEIYCACRENLCKNGGTCTFIEQQLQPICLCKEPFTGQFCEKGIERCKRFKCEIIDGQCTMELGQVICDCSIRYHGTFCGTDECPVMYAQCKNGEKCPPMLIPCYCYESSLGEFCSIPIEYVNYLCGSNCKATDGFCAIEKNQTSKCMCPEGTEYKWESGCTSLTEKCPLYCEETGGICTSDRTGRMYCRCHAGITYVNYFGCQECPSYCKETGGFCTIENNQTAKCMCPVGTDYKWESGCTSLKEECPLYCEETGGICTSDRIGRMYCKCPNDNTYVNYFGCRGACRENLCKNGGTCNLIGHHPVCLCKEPFAGYFCEKRIDLPQNNTIIYAVICAVLLIPTVIVLCLLCKKIRSMRK